jgi:hypothetical protein
MGKSRSLVCSRGFVITLGIDSLGRDPSTLADPLHRTAVAQDDKKKNNYKVLRLVGRRATSSLGMTGTKLTVVNA